MIRHAARVALVVLCAIAIATPALAQRRPQTPPGQAKRAQQVPSTSGLVSTGAETDVAAASGRVRTLGAWLDDASVLAPGEAWLALSMSKWDMPVATGADAPVIDLSLGLTPRVQTSLTLPYFRISDRTGGTFRGLGDMYVSTKVILRDAAAHPIGVSIGPTLEILSDTSVAGTGLRRVNWILPVNLERRFDVGRVYGSAGYFTRGVLFASGAYEYPVTDRLAVAAALTHAYATDAEALSEELGLGRRRVDLSGTASYAVAPALAIFGSLGRTVWGLDDDSTRMLASVGVAINMEK
jgi:hypothetical protein